MPCTSVQTPQIRWAKCPGITGVAVAQDDFDAADHRARRIGLGNPVAVHLRFDPQVTLDSCNRIYNYTVIHDNSYLF